MNTSLHPFFRQTGFSMIEVLVTLIILLVGLLGLAGMMIQSQRSEVESYQRVQAMIIVQDMVARINANRNVAQCYAYTTSPTSPYLGTVDSGTLTLPVGTCATSTAPGATAPTANQLAQFQTDLAAWNTLLLGAAETMGGGANTGAIVGARGCVSYDPNNTVPDMHGVPIPGSGLYTVSVAWQGMGETFQNTTLLCGQNQYGVDTKRRVASETFRIGTINNTN